MRRFLRLSRRRKLLLFATLVLSFCSWILMRFFRKSARFERRKRGPEREADARLVSDIRWAVFAVNRYVPWENVCRHQAWQALYLCRYYGIPCEIFVGFRKNKESGEIEGHAWTLIKGEFVTGFCDPEEYTVQGVYA